MKFLKGNFSTYLMLMVVGSMFFFSSCKTDMDEMINSSQQETTELNLENQNLIQEDKIQSGFQDMIYDNETTLITGRDTKQSNNQIDLNGAFTVSDQGKVIGTAQAQTKDRRINGNITINGGLVSYKTNDALVEFDVINNEYEMTISADGKNTVKTVDFFETMEAFADAQMKSTSKLSVELQAIGAYLALTNSEVWTRNSKYALTTDVIYKGFWCKAAATAAAGTIAAIGGGLCFLVASGCAGGTAVTLGGLAVPCAYAVGLCAGGTWVGAASTYQLMVAWLC